MMLIALQSIPYGFYYALELFWILSGLKEFGTQLEVLTILTLKFKVFA